MWKAIAALISRHEFDDAETRLNQLISGSPDSFRAYYALANLLETRQRNEEAIANYEKAISLVPGHAGPHTRRSILLFRSHFQTSQEASTGTMSENPSRSRITMRSLGLNGRFGNQILQYGFLRIYATAHNLLAETPDWIGRYIFDLDDPHISCALPGVRENGDLFVRSLNREIPETLANYDIWGYCCYHTRALSGYRDNFRSLFAFSRIVRPVLENTLAALEKRGKTLVVLHLRRADFGAGKFWIAPENWYMKWLESVWDDLDDPVLYIASDEPGAVLPAFENYNPVIATDVADLIPGIEFLHDFYLMTQADCLAISNSTFSFTAAMINRKAESFLRPDRTRHRLIEYDPWNADVLLE